MGLMDQNGPVLERHALPNVLFVASIGFALALLGLFCVTSNQAQGSEVPLFTALGASMTFLWARDAQFRLHAAALFCGLPGLWALEAWTRDMTAQSTLAVYFPPVAAALGWAVAVGTFLYGVVGMRRGYPYSASIALFSVCVLFALAVGGLSGEAGGAGGMVEWLIRTFHLSEVDAHRLLIAFRKSVHFLAYGLAAWCFFAAAVWTVSRHLAALLALSFAAMIGAFDETRQAFSEGRTGSLADVGLDLAGAIAFVALALLVSRGRRKQPFRQTDVLSIEPNEEPPT